jgi:prevent-host-death family protein
MDVISIHKAKTTLSQLLARVERGEEIILARGKQPVAKLVPIQAMPTERKFGRFKGVFEVGPEFFEPLSEEELAAWE